ncbi:hypothetical protein NQZ79_g7884 [Umbelopsis isabellina]|nr:hypothetical protein NQZ79_g7884 [Umbelopsis isabellina]
MTSHLAHKPDPPRHDLLPPTPTSLYNQKLTLSMPTTPPPLPPPHADTANAIDQETWNRLNLNHKPANYNLTLPQQRSSKSDGPPKELRLPFTPAQPPPGGLEYTWEQKYGLATPANSQQQQPAVFRQSAPSGYFARHDSRQLLPSERYDRRSFVMPTERYRQIPRVSSNNQYVLPPLDRYHNREPPSPPHYTPAHRDTRIASLPQLPSESRISQQMDSADQTPAHLPIQPSDQQPRVQERYSENELSIVPESPSHAQRSQSVSYGSMFNQVKQDRDRHKEHELFLSKGTPLVYPGLLSLVAQELKRQVEVGTRIKDGLEYKNVFDGRQAVTKLSLIICTNNRQHALRLGRALESQKLFHDVSYEHRLLDSDHELYQFHDHVMHITSYRETDLDMTGKEEIPDEKYEESESSFEVNYDEPVSGVYTELTNCYSPTCTGSRPCYSRSCPKRFIQNYVDDSGYKSSLNRSVSATLSHTPPQELWVNQVSSTIADSLTKQDRKRQENIFELIYTEKNFVTDIEYVYQMWIVPLLTTDALPASRREHFVHTVFSNITAIHEVNSRLLFALQKRQSEHPVVSQIGDVMLAHVVNFEPFVEYGARQYGAKMAFERERAVNQEFDAFIKEVERKPESRKLEINGYLTKPTTRLGRYNLLLGEILKHTPEGHSDCVVIKKVMDIITKFLRRVNIESGNAKNKFDLRQLHDNMSFKNKSDDTDLDLLAEERVIIKQGSLKKTAALDSTNYQLILLDNYLLITKLKVVGLEEHYTVQRKPIPLELLMVGVPEQTRVRRASSILPYARPGSTIPNVNLSVNAPVWPTVTDVGGYTSNKGGFPISFHHVGRKGSGHFTLYAPTLAARRPWIDKIEKQKELSMKNRRIFELVPICDRLFCLTNRVNHSVSFDNGRYFLLAADQGVYLARAGDIAPPRRILHLDHCSQVQVIEETFTVLVVADRVLWEFPFDILHTKHGEKPDAGRKLRNHTSFIFVGECLNKKLICIPKSSTLNSYVSAYEPTLPREIKKKSTFGRTKNQYEVGLRFFKEIYIPGEAWSVDLSPTKMFITCQRGVQLVDMRTTNTQALLDPNDPDLAFILDRERPDSVLNIRTGVKHICTYRIDADEHLVCYDEYAFYIDGKGRRKRTGFLIEWEGQPESFAFHHPYVLAFEPSFIEVRHMLTGELEQIIPGVDMMSLLPSMRKGTIRGAMTDQHNDVYQVLFELKSLVNPNETKIAPSQLHSLAYRQTNQVNHSPPSHHTWNTSRNLK